jgi:hypothetical protein
VTSTLNYAKFRVLLRRINKISRILSWDFYVIRTVTNEKATWRNFCS